MVVDNTVSRSHRSCALADQQAAAGLCSDHLASVANVTPSESVHPSPTRDNCASSQRSRCNHRAPAAAFCDQIISSRSVSHAPF